MKKILALLLVVLMLGSVTAFADNASLFTLSDPVVDLDFGEEPIHIDLAGLSFAVATVTVDEQEVLALNIRGDGECLLAAAFRVVGNRFLFDVDGLSHTYYAAIPAVEESEEAAAPSINLDELNIDMDALLESVMSELVIESEGDTTSFTLPYTAINAVIEQIVPAVVESGKLPEGLNADEALDALTQLKESDSGVTVTGSLTQSETGMNGDMQFFPVEAGETASDPAATASFVLDDVFSLDLDASGVASFHVGFDPNDGKVDFSVSAEGQSVSFSAVVGSEEGEIQVAELGDPASAIDVQTLTDEDTEALGTEIVTAADALLNFLMPVLEQLV